MDAALAQTPVNFGPKVVFGKLLSVSLPQLCRKKLIADYAFMMTGTVCFGKKTNICNVKFGDLEANRNWGKNSSSNRPMPYLESPILISLSLCNFYAAIR